MRDFDYFTLYSSYVTYAIFFFFIFQVCLTLTNKFSGELNSNQKLDMDRLFVKTKQLIMIVLPCTYGDNLIGCLKSKTLIGQEDQYWEIIAKRERADQAAQVNASMINHTNHFKVITLRLLNFPGCP